MVVEESGAHGDRDPRDDREAEILAEAVHAAEEALNPEDEATEAGVRRQMDSLYVRDRWMSLAFVVALLVVLPFIVISMWSIAAPGTRAVIIVAGAVVAIYNVASMLKLVRTYHEDRDFIYRRDVAHLRELRAARRLAREKA
jgi:hypothetical protein